MLKIRHGMRTDKNGWIYASINGTARQRGFAHGYLLAPEIKELFRMLDFRFPNAYGYTRAFFSEVVSTLYAPRIKKNYPEFYEEMVYITKGARKNKVDVSLADIITWNCYMSIDALIGSMPRLIKEHPVLNLKYGKLFPDIVMIDHQRKDRCSAFMAVGSATKDGKIVCGHNSFADFIDGQYYKVVLDLRPAKGQRILMQTGPGCISSNTDFYVTSAGFICTETTIGGFNKFILRDPLCCRIRQAMQYATTLDECVKILRTNNGGDNANSWLIGDTQTNTILRLELGLNYYNMEKKTDGYFIGFNAADDPRIRNLECTNSAYYDIRQHQGSRRVRLGQLMRQHAGKIDTTLGKEILADHYDVYLKRENPGSRTCCGHYEVDPRKYMSKNDRQQPYQPIGALDGIVCDTTMAQQMSFVGRWGNSCGRPFDPVAFIGAHPQWQDQEPYLHPRPRQPWTRFTILN